MGVYALEEGFTTELMESQGRRAGLLLRLNEDLMWSNITTFWSHDITQEGNFMVTDMESAPIAPFDPSKINEDPALAEEAKTAENMLRAFQSGKQSASDVFDVGLMGRFFALSDLWSACHGVAWHNLRFYYNPVTALLEPVAYDAEPFQWCDQQHTIVVSFIEDAPEALMIQIYVLLMPENLKRIANPAYVVELQREMENENVQVASALKSEFPDDDVAIYWNALIERSKALALELQPAQPLRGSYQLVSSGIDHSILNIDLINLMLFPVEIERLEIDGQVYSLANLKNVIPPVLDPKIINF